MKISLISVNTSAADQGIRSLSSYLKSKGHLTQLIFLPESENYNVMYSAKVLQQLRMLCKNSDLIGLSSMASTAKRAIQVISALRILKKPIIYGGVHAAISPGLCIKEADIVCVGEGEEALLELMNKMRAKKSINKIKNLWIKTKTRIIKNPPRPLITNVDNLPYPDYSLKDHYIFERGKIIPFEERHLNGYIFFLTGRGCPYSCTYCSNRFFNDIYCGKWSKVRWNSPEYIIKGILLLKNKYPSLKIFDIRDDTFSLRPTGQIKKFCNLYKENVKLRMKCLGDVKTISDEKIKLLVEAGCTDIIMGIQGIERINFEIYKRFQKNSDVLKAAKILNKYKDKLAVMYDVITSNPYEGPEDIINMIRLLQKIPKPYFLSVNNLVFFTGSELYKKAKQDGIIKTEKDSAANLNYWDRFKHIKLKKKNEYLCLILNLMRGVTTKNRFGIMPGFLINFLLTPSLVRFNLKHKSFTYFIGSIVGIFDSFRENIAKPIYRSMPLSFKIWYDKVRYRI